MFLKFVILLLGYLARNRYEKMKSSAVTIQSAFRGWVVRRKYSKVRKGVVALQAVYRQGIQILSTFYPNFIQKYICLN
jgi:myosin heavy subunit